jgi:hypothetical protein
MSPIQPSRQAAPNAKPTPKPIQDGAIFRARPAEHDAQPVNFGEFIKRAMREPKFEDRVPAGLDEPTHRLERSGNIATTMNLGVEPVERRQVVARDENTTRAHDLRGLPVNAALGAEQAHADHALALIQAGSVIGQAGAVIEPYPSDKGRIWTLGEAEFHQTPNDADAPDAGIEFAAAGDWDLHQDGDFPAWGCSLDVTRRMQKLAGVELVESLLRGAIQRGARRVIDKAAVAAITAARPAGAAPTLADLAAAGITEASSVRAVIGTGGDASTGLAIDGGSGRANVHGYAAAGLSRDLAETAIIGDFEKLLMMVDPEVHLLAHRYNVTGSLEIAAFFNVQPILLDSARFWILAAA